MPLYVADYLADTSHLNCAESGAYLHLIMHYWQKGGLPIEDKRLASIARATPEQWSDMRDTIADFFGDGWTHSRIDEELESARKAYERRAAAGRAGGKAKADGKQSSSNAKAMPEQSQPQSQQKEEVANATSSPEPAKAAPVAVIGLPTVSDGDFPVTADDIAEWQTAFPAVAVRQQLASMRQWLLANTTKRKTARGMKRFVVSWLDRKQNEGGAVPSPRGQGPPSPARTVSDVLGEMAAGTWTGPRESLPNEPFIETSFTRRN